MDRLKEVEQSVGGLIHDVMRLWRRNFDRRAKELGLTRSQWRVLVQLIRYEGINQAALADVLEIEPISLVRHLDKLEAAGLVERRADPNDRRARLLYFQPSAEDTLDRIWEMGMQTRTDALEGLSPKEEEMLSLLLKRVKANLSEKERAVVLRCGVRGPADGE